jgi:hypothetical protein
MERINFMSRRAPKEIMTERAFQGTIEDMVGLGYTAEDIGDALCDTNQYIISKNIAEGGEVIRSRSMKIALNFGPYERIQEVQRCQLIMPTNRKEWFLFDPFEKLIKPIKRENVILDFKDPNRYKQNSKHVIIEYTPKREMGLFKDDYMLKFNVYKAPKWKLPTGSVYPTTEMPPIYTKFLTYFTGGDEESVNYILDWLAYSIQNKQKNKTYLTAIGAQGVGKGIMAKIIAQLHGPKNSSDVLFKSIGKQFNKQFADKTFVFLDEVKKATEDEMNALKKQEGDVQEIELKGVDAQSVENHNNIYIASNNLDSLRLEPDDRRHGIINIGTNRLQNVLTQDEIHSLYQNEENIKNLGYFLMNRIPNPKYLAEGYKSQNAKRVLDASAYEWEKHFIDSFCHDFAGQSISCVSVAKALGAEFPKFRGNINTSMFTLLSKKFDGVFSVSKIGDFSEFTTSYDLAGLKHTSKESGKRLFCVKILPLDKQKKHDIIEKEEE